MSGQTIKADVISIEAVTDYVKIVKFNPLKTVSFKAGQYLKVVLNADDQRIFSIASSPQSEIIELHIGAGSNDVYPQEALDHIAQHLSNNTPVTLEVGLGDAYFQDNSARPVILMAGGTGFSYIKSIAEYLINNKPNLQVKIYWGGKNQSSLYANELVKTWAEGHPNFTYIPVVEQAGSDWTGKTGYVHHAVIEDIKNLNTYDIYLAGSFKMASIAHDDFIANGAIKEQMFADAFSFI